MNAWPVFPSWLWYENMMPNTHTPLPCFFQALYRSHQWIDHHESDQCHGRAARLSCCVRQWLIHRGRLHQPCPQQPPEWDLVPRATLKDEGIKQHLYLWPLSLIKTPLTLPKPSYSLRCNILFSHHHYLKRGAAQHTQDQSGPGKKNIIQPLLYPQWIFIHVHLDRFTFRNGLINCPALVDTNQMLRLSLAFFAKRWDG